MSRRDWVVIIALAVAFPTAASKITAVVASAAVRLAQHKAKRL